MDFNLLISMEKNNAKQIVGKKVVIIKYVGEMVGMHVLCDGVLLSLIFLSRFQ